VFAMQSFEKKYAGDEDKIQDELLAGRDDEGKTELEDVVK
jgi:hypothetical protein